MDQEALRSQGFVLTSLKLPDPIIGLVKCRDWVGLDQAFHLETAPGGIIYSALEKYASFSAIEFIISIRSSLVEPDEDGIWHDDGSRVMAFSLSLTLNPESLVGGRLEVRRKGSSSAEIASIATPPFGTLIVFATGRDGFEHKINRIEAGERVIIAGWCS